MPHRITISSMDDLQRFVNEYRPTVHVVAKIISRKLQVFPDPDAYPDANTMMDDLRRFLARYRGQDLPLFMHP